MDSLDAPCCFQEESKNKNWGVLEQPLSQWVIGENFCRLGLLMAPGSTLAVIHVLKLQAYSSTPPSLKSLLPAWKHHRDLLFPLRSFLLWALRKGATTCLGHGVATLPPKTRPEGNWCSPRLARLRVRTPSAVVLSPPMEEVFSTAFMFSCSAASSAYCSPWGWLWQGGELLENLPDCRRKTDLLF